MRQIPFALILLSLCTISFAQILPNAGSLLQQIERDQNPLAPKPKGPIGLLSPPTELIASDGLSLKVSEFVVVGNRLISSDQLSAALDSFKNRALDFNGLSAAAAAVAKVYQDAGWVVRTYLPEQDIKDGRVTIQVVESVFGRAHIFGAPEGRVKAEDVLEIFNAQQKPGEPLSAGAINRALLIADDLPGVSVSGRLRAGAEPSQTDVDLQLNDEPLLGGSVGVDNFGSRSIGSTRETANLFLNSPLQWGDLESLSLMHTQGSDYVRAEGSLPLGFDGLRVGMNGSHMKYVLVAPEFASLNAGGNSSTVGLSATYPWLRSSSANLRLSLSLDAKAFTNYSFNATTTNYRNNLMTLALDGNSFDAWARGGVNNINLALIRGRLNLNGSPNQATDALTTQTQGDYLKARFGMSRQQSITSDLAFFAAVSAQVANKNLDSSEKFYLGGAGAVRAYPSNEGGGTAGQLLNLELRYSLTQGFRVTGFYDVGHITINTNNNFTNASALNTYTLKGAGLALEWRTNEGTAIKAIVSRRIGLNPNLTSTGNDQDGSLVINRFWLSAEKSF